MPFDRLSLFEFFAFWRDGTTASELAQTLGLERETVQRTIVSEYRARFGRDNLILDKTSKRTRVANVWELKCSPDRVLDAVNFSSALQAFSRAAGRDGPPIGGVQIEDLLTPVESEAETERFRKLYAATARQLPVFLRYVAKTRVMDGLFSPHALVRAPDRLHFRCFEHPGDGNGRYIDIVPGRIADIKFGEANEYVGSNADTEWHARTSVFARLNPELAPGLRASLAYEYNLDAESDLIEIPDIRRAVAMYLVRALETRRVYGSELPLWIDASFT